MELKETPIPFPRQGITVHIQGNVLQPREFSGANEKRQKAAAAPF